MSDDFLTIELTRTPELPEDVLAAFVFDDCDEAGQPTVLSSGGDGTLRELWRTGAAVETGIDGLLSWRATSGLLFGRIAVFWASDAVASTRSVYRQILAFVRTARCSCLLRIWNFMPGINTGDGDRERYKDFSTGRTLAFVDEAADRSILPAATAIGTRSGDRLEVCFLAARQPGQRLENPRQVSAYEYPRRYGPRPPLFARAALFGTRRQNLLLVSGTASIVGSESRHAGCLLGQLRETWRNVERLCAEAGDTHPLSLRVYIRHRADYPAVVDFVGRRVAAGVAVVYLLADICRIELLVEIEGVYQVGSASG